MRRHRNGRAVARMTAVAVAMLAAGCASTRESGWPGREVPQPEYARMESAGREPVPDPAPAAASSGRGIGHRALWYVPNRLLDLVDIFRFRVRAGPGLAAQVRLTDYADAYIGRYHAVFVGLPGPRLRPAVRWPWGLEQERGIKLLGVDATDDLPHDPGYSPTEFNAGAQVLLLGLDVGVDPVELGDFLAGWLLIDVREDDR